MNAAQVHLTINHLPVLLPFVANGLILAGLYARSADLKKAGLVFLIIAALVAIPAYLTGEPAETILKNYPGASRVAMHEHEDSALYALISIEIGGAFALLATFFWLKKKFVPSYVWATLVLLVTFACVVMLKTAHLGGIIRHEEIQTPEERSRFDAG